MTDSTVRDHPESVQTIYERLAAKFEVTHTDVRGGVSLTYITGEQVVSRLNEVLSVAGWDFRVLAHDINPEADEAWSLGELIARIDGVTVVRQQFGSQKIRRSRSTGAPLDLGFDLKGASTDAMKKCASLLGVGLYLSAKDEPQSKTTAQRPTPIARQVQPAQAATPRIRCQQPTGVVTNAGLHETCGQTLDAVPDRGWSAPQLANEGMTLCRRALCWQHFQEQSQRKAG